MPSETATTLPSASEIVADANDYVRGVAAAGHRGLCIAVLERGFVYVGQCSIWNDWLTIEGARCVRRWGTTQGLGQLAAEGPTPKTVLDAPGTIEAPLNSVIHLIRCTPEHWS